MCGYILGIRRALYYSSVHICWSGLSAGAIVGIVITVVVALAVLGFVGTKLADNRKKIARSVPVHAFVSTHKARQLDCMIMGVMRT